MQQNENVSDVIQQYVETNDLTIDYMDVGQKRNVCVASKETEIFILHVNNDGKYFQVDDLYDGFTCACWFGCIDVIKYLLANIGTITINEEGFYYACEEGHIEIVKALLEFMKTNEVTINVQRCVEYAFFHACVGGDVDVVKYVLNYASENENELKHKYNEVFERLCDIGNIEMMKYLLEYMKDNNQEIDITANGNGAFIAACINNQLEVVRFLMRYARKHGLEIDVTVKNDYTFRMALTLGHSDIVKYLVDECNADGRYHVKIEDGKIKEWKISDEMGNVLEDRRQDDIDGESNN